MNIVLVEPEIPANTGNIGRTCVITGARLHLIKPFGFLLDDKSIKRAGMDYWSSVDLKIYDCLEDFLEKNKGSRLIMATTKTKQMYSDFVFKDDDFILFGPESRGLPERLLEKNKENCIKIPMKKHPLARSLNLSNSVSVILYEALRQLDFKGL